VDQIVEAEGLTGREQMEQLFGTRWLFYLRPWIIEVARQLRAPTWLIQRRKVPGEYLCLFPNSLGCRRWVAQRMTSLARAA